MSALIYQRAFCDTFGLRILAEGRVPEIADVKRRIFVAERRSDTGRPDHFYKNYLDERLQDVTGLHQLPGVVLSKLAERFITRVGDRLHIRTEAFADWQELLPRISPLAVIVAFLVDEERGPRFGQDPRRWLAREIGDTALLCPRQPELEHLIERDGLNELHMHLNGSTELDILWSDAVRFPDRYLYELEDARAKACVSTGELYDQIELGLSPFEYYRRLRSARRIRHLAAALLRSRIAGAEDPVSLPQLLAAMDTRRRDSTCPVVAGLALGQAPISQIHRGPPAPPLIEEAAFLYILLQGLRLPGGPDRRLGLALYFNLLVQTQLAQIAVQQTDQIGFDQFQKFTDIGVRERLERGYEARFRQLNGAAPHRTLRHVEGRLAPKNDVASLLELIGRIVDGWLGFRGCPRRKNALGLAGAAPGCLTANCPSSCRGASGRPDAELALVLHFIKKRSPRLGGQQPQALDMALRADLRVQAQVVREVVERSGFVRQILRGIDAASNELHAPPEAFAPTFRYLRRHGLQHATFHVGEDFVHLVSGIRACAEAKAVLPLGPGDRMGHATALGISPELWISRMGKKLMIGVGEHLDNLVYAHARLSAQAKTATEAQRLESEIALLSARIYGVPQPPALLYNAWMLRTLDILEVLELERGTANTSDTEVLANAAAAKARSLNTPTRRVEVQRIATAAQDHPHAYQLFRHRHRNSKLITARIEIDAAWLPVSALTALQADVLDDLARTGVAIETLPTSNVRISFYERLDEHHLFRWLNLTGNVFDSMPAICVGSDDAGIFATSLRNEYAAIHDVLRRQLSRRPEEAMSIIERLNRNGAAWRFAPTAAESRAK